MLKLHFKKKFYRIFSFLFVVLIFFISPCSRYLDTSSIEKVYATGGELAAGGALAADAVMKFLIGLFGTVAAAEAYEQYKDEVNQSFYEYMSAPGRWGEIIGDSAKDACVKIYDKTTNTIKEIPWEEMMQSLVDGHDSVVDSLTGLYAQYCPGLLKSFDDFITDLLNDEVYIPGFSEVMSDTIFTDYESIKDISGNYVITGYAYGMSSNGRDTISYIYNSTSQSRPFIIIDYLVSFERYTGDGTRHSSQGLYVNYSMYRSGKFDYSGSHTGFSVSPFDGYGFNIPIFSSYADFYSSIESNDFSSALNYSDTTMETVIDLTKVPDLAPDIPPFTKSWQRTQWGEVSDVIDFGGILAGDYADDLPFWDLDRIDELAQSIQDIFDKALEGIFEGTDVIEFPTTYDDVWDDVFDGVWDGVKDGALDIPVDDTGNPSIPYPYPWDPSIPSNPDIPDNPAVDIPDDSVVDIPIEDIVPTVNDSFFDIAGSLRYKFPFSIPWDVYHLFTILAGMGDSSSAPVQTYGISSDNIQTYAGKTRDAPYFELPIVIERYGIDEKIIIDMEPFEPLSILSRSLFSLLFGMFLINLTFKVVGMRKEE